MGPRALANSDTLPLLERDPAWERGSGDLALCACDLEGGSNELFIEGNTGRGGGGFLGNGLLSALQDGCSFCFQNSNTLRSSINDHAMHLVTAIHVHEPASLMASIIIIMLSS